MDREIKIQKTVYNKQDLDLISSREFTTFTRPVQQEDTITIEEFFDLYEKLYVEIPVEGDVNSHRYLVERSSELVSFDTNTEEIQPLLDEITQLRLQLLDANEQIIELQTQTATNANN